MVDSYLLDRKSRGLGTGLCLYGSSMGIASVDDL